MEADMEDQMMNDLQKLIDAEHILPVIEWVAEQMPGGFFIYRADESQEVLYVNSAVLRMFGCKTLEEYKDLTGFTFRGLVHPDDFDAVQASIDWQIANEENENLDYVEYRIVRKDGSVRWVDDYGHFADLPGYGKVYYVFIRDITEKHLALEENELGTQVITGLSVDFTSIYLLDLDDGAMRPYRLQNKYIIDIANEMASGTGESADWRSVLPVYAERYVIPEDREFYLREASEERISERLQTERSYTVNYRCRMQEDELIYMSMSIVRIDSGGQSRRAVMGYRDITEETLRVQRELAAHMRTEMELEREKHANEVKSSFLFNISHDIRTPMNAIMGFSDLAKRHIGEPDKLRHYLGKVDDSNHQLLALIDDLLEMSKIEYGRIELKARPCDLVEQLGMVVDLFRSQIGEKQIRLEERFELPEGKVLVDANRFRRIMSNLVSNAVKFTPNHGKIEITARQKQVSDSGYARYEFTVSDNGVGMTEEFMHRMYDAFEREESSTKAGTTGTGLGLTITKNLLDAMGGSIFVKSKKGEGTTFTVDVPLKLADETSGEGQYDTFDAEDGDEDFYARGKHRILLVEDIEINRMLAETILEEAGFSVESVTDGCDAVEIITNHPQWYYDLVLMDIQMPVMNGYEATRAIRAIGRADTNTLPIIALSANARDEDRRLSMESGMNNHIAKPFDIAQLISTVNEYIAQREIDRGEIRRPRL